MSEPEALSPEELEVLRDLLLRTLESLSESRAASSEEAKPVDLGLSIGRLSRMDALQQQHMAAARKQRVELQIEQARAALRRMDSATYGACARCEEPIGFARLRVRPDAVFCMACQGSPGR